MAQIAHLIKAQESLTYANIFLLNSTNSVLCHSTELHNLEVQNNYHLTLWNDFVYS